MNESAAPELLRKPLSLTIVNLLGMNVNPKEFEWIQSPDPVAIHNAWEELNYLGAISDNKLTELGQVIATLQIDPGMGRMVYAACKEGFGTLACKNVTFKGETAATIAAIMSVSSMMYWRGGDDKTKKAADDKHINFMSNEGDIVSMYHTFKQWHGIMHGLVTSPSNMVAKEDIEIELDEEPTATELTAETLQELEKDSKEINDTDVEDDKASSSSDEERSSVESMSEQDPEEEQTTEPDMEVEEQEQKLRITKETAALAKAWCCESFINSKAMGIALQTQKDIVRALKSMKIWSFCQKQGRNPSDEELRRLAFKAMFLNIACKIKSNTYCSLSVGTIGGIHPGSSIYKKRQEPEWLVYQSIFSSGRTMFTQITPCSSDWIKQESVAFFNFIMKQKEQARTQEGSFPASKAEVQAIVGKFDSNLEPLGKELDCVVEGNYEAGLISFWCQPSRVEEVKKLLAAKIQVYHESLKKEILEEVTVGSTRAVYGRGGQVELLLFAKEYISINIRNIPEEFTIGELQKLSAQYGDVRECKLIPSSNSTNKKQWAHITFSTVEAAKKALRELSNYQSWMVTPGGIRQPIDVREIEGYLQFSWAKGPSLGKAIVTFAAAIEANNVLDRNPFGSKTKVRPFLSKKKDKDGTPSLKNKHEAQGKYSYLKMLIGLAQVVNDRFVVPNTPAEDSKHYTIYITGLPLHMDEETIVELLRNNGYALPKIVCVQRSPGTNNSSVDDIVQSIPLPERKISHMLFEETRSQRAGMKVFYATVEDVKVIHYTNNDL